MQCEYRVVMSTTKEKIVILGAGFAGLYAYKELCNELHGTDTVEIKLVNADDEFVFVPMIHEVAAGTLMPRSITQSLRALSDSCLDEFIHGTVAGIDLDAKIVQVEYHQSDEPDQIHHHHHEEISYDTLVLALGSETNYFGVPGADKYSLPLKTLADAKRLKNHVIERFEEADRLTDEKKQCDILRFVIVGGGATGVEFAGELLDLINTELYRAFPRLEGCAEVCLVEGGDMLVKQVDPWFGTRIKKALARAGCRLIFNKRVTGIEADKIIMGEDELMTKSVIWSGGVRARSVAIASNTKLAYDDRSHRIRVTPELHTAEYPEVFVSGDQAWVESKEAGMPYPMRAQFATREGELIGKNIARRLRGQILEEFEWDEQGFIISLGGSGAFAEVFGMKLSGMPAQILYRAAYIAKTMGVRSKWRMASDWILNIFEPRDISKL